MGRNEPLLLEDFVIPSLNSKRFPDKMFWTKKSQEFVIMWNHMSVRTWSPDHFQVFCEWDKIKKRYDPTKPDYYMSSKGRFRSALHRLENVEIVQSNKKYRIYKIKGLKNRKRKNASTKKNQPARKTALVPITAEPEITPTYHVTNFETPDWSATTTDHPYSTYRERSQSFAEYSSSDYSANNSPISDRYSPVTYVPQYHVTSTSGQLPPFNESFVEKPMTSLSLIDDMDRCMPLPYSA